MAAELGSGRSPSPNKEDVTSGFNPSLRGDNPVEIQLTNSNVLRRATLKIDLYLIPILAMYCVSSLLPSPSAAWCSMLISR
jgi:hypothetical protein